MRSKVILWGLCCGVLSCMPAFAQATGTGGTGAGGGDQKFVDFAAQTDMMEAHLGQMAAQQSDRQDVKDFAQMLTTDHTNDYQQLQMAVTKAGDTVPKGLDAAHDRMIAPLEHLKGAAFDRKFIQMMITGHEQAIAEYNREIKDGTNQDIKNYAQTALPVLQKHLDAARGLEKAAKK